MTTIKEKLLEAIGNIDISDIGNSALVDILVSKLKGLRKNVKKFVQKMHKNVKGFKTK